MRTVNLEPRLLLLEQDGICMKEVRWLYYGVATEIVHWQEIT